MWRFLPGHVRIFETFDHILIYIVHFSVWNVVMASPVKLRCKEEDIAPKPNGMPCAFSGFVRIVYEYGHERVSAKGFRGSLSSHSAFKSRLLSFPDSSLKEIVPYGDVGIGYICAAVAVLSSDPRSMASHCLCLKSVRLQRGSGP